MGKVYCANNEYKSKFLSRKVLASVKVCPPEFDNNELFIKLIETVNSPSGSRQDYLNLSFRIKAEEPKMLSGFVNNDQAAYMIAALVLRKYVFIFFDFEVSRQALKRIEKITGATVTAASVTENMNDFNLGDTRQALSLVGDSSCLGEALYQHNFAINLSGGLDSAALFRLCPGLTPVSLEFDSPSPGELAARKMHRKLGGISVETNISDYVFPHFSNGYFNIGSILLADAYNISVAANAKLMCDGKDWWTFLKGDTQAFLETIEAAKTNIYGVKMAYPFLGFTKAGVHKLLYRLDPGLYDELMSDWFEYNRHDLNACTAARTRLLLDMVSTGKERESDWVMPMTSWNDHRLYTYYLVKKLGAKKVSEYFYDVPNGIETFLKNISMDWMEKYDRETLKYLPADFRIYFEGCLERAAVEFYSEKDYEDRKNVLNGMDLA
ncbi:MAG: hypothetical protein LBR74_05740 [Eubacterium sp.]|jgi:hypothetical protein|nr:hypothetical protein [Eubacterium sp.]